MGDRVATGIAGFDRLIGGGFPRGTLNLLAGPAGSGKSLFGLHFVYNGAALPSSGAKRLVVDSLSVLGLYYPNPEQLRERLFAFSRFLRSRDLTTLLLTESIEGAGLTRYGVEQFVADSFVHLGLEEVKGDLRRTLTVRKMRFTHHDASKHPVHIGPSGMVVLDEEKVI